MKRLFIPVHLNVKELLSKNNKKHIDKYHYFLHKLYEERILNKTLKNKDRWVPLSTRVMESIVSARQYQKIKSFFINHGIVECDERYSAGDEYHVHEKKCKWYRFTEDYKQVKVTEYMIEDEVFEKKLQRFKVAKATKIDTKVKQFLHFNLQEILINQLAANLEINNKLFHETDDYDLEKANFDTIAVCKIASKDFFFHQDPTSNRIHTNITNLSSWIRKHLYIETGEELVNLDIRNSQPLLLSILLKREYPIMPPDALKYIGLCESGMFYEYMMDELKVPLNTNRKDFKQKMFAKIFYCKLNEYYMYNESKVFAQLFPSCFAVIKKYKKGNYKNLAIAMQKAESSILLDGVIGKLSSMFSLDGVIGKLSSMFSPEDLFCITIHDSIITTESQSEIVRQLMLDEFLKHGLKPTINIEKISEK